MDVESDSFSPDELALLDPRITRITDRVQSLAPADRLTALLFIFDLIRRKHQIDETFNLIEFVSGERTQQQLQIAA